MKQMIMHLSRLLPAIALLLLGACTIDIDISGGVNGFKCASSEDCVSGYICDFPGSPAGAFGTCVDAAAQPDSDCVDMDNDGAFVGTNCPPGVPYDCDDTNAAVHPLAIEICDGLDNNCNGKIDEELPDLPCPKQLGVCAGASRGCVDGAYADCAETGLYGPDYELVETRCDGLDNDCNGNVDGMIGGRYDTGPNSICQCDPANPSALECGTEIGTCTRGIKYCQPSGRYSECVQANIGRVCNDGRSCSTDADCSSGTCGAETCESNDDCGTGGFCVSERMDSREDLADNCRESGNPNCERQVCRYLPPSAIACEQKSDCYEGEDCLFGFCRQPVVKPAPETCNGLDDNCDGIIDNDVNRLQICGPCPFNSVLMQYVQQNGNRAWICVDWYEASRPDATADSAGELNYYAVPQEGVLPWTGITPGDAQAACRGDVINDLSGSTSMRPVPLRFLCDAYQWEQACGGISGTEEESSYPWVRPGDPDSFEAGNCNDGHNTSGVRLRATGTAYECERGGVHDMVGNAAEIVMVGGNPRIAGGSFNDTDGDVLSCRQSDFLEVPANVGERDDIGFRCCTLRKE